MNKYFNKIINKIFLKKRKGKDIEKLKKQDLKTKRMKK